MPDSQRPPDTTSTPDAECTSRAVGPTQSTPLHNYTRPLKFTYLFTTRRSCLCRVWCAGVNWTIALNVFRLQVFYRRQSWRRCRESSSHRRSGRDTDKTLSSCLAWRCELALSRVQEVDRNRACTAAWSAVVLGWWCWLQPCQRTAATAVVQPEDRTRGWRRSGGCAPSGRASGSWSINAFYTSFIHQNWWYRHAILLYENKVKRKTSHYSI